VEREFLERWGEVAYNELKVQLDSFVDEQKVKNKVRSLENSRVLSCVCYSVFFGFGRRVRLLCARVCNGGLIFLDSSRINFEHLITLITFQEVSDHHLSVYKSTYVEIYGRRLEEGRDPHKDPE
jgi:hypothetical protein